MENTATKMSVTASDTTKKFVTLRSFRKTTNARMTSELPRRVRMMIMIRNKVETNLTAKLNDSPSVAGDVVAFMILDGVESAILFKWPSQSLTEIFNLLMTCQIFKVAPYI